MTNTLIRTALAPKTQEAYKRSLKSYLEFAKKYGIATNLPIKVSHLSYFLTYLHNRGAPASSLASICSGISYFHKFYKVPNPSQDFVIQQIIVAARKQPRPSDKRRPITLTILKMLINALNQKPDMFKRPCLFGAMFTIAFHFGLRISEITDSEHNLRLQDIVISSSCLKINFRSYKHSPEHPNSHEIKASTSLVCPVRLLSDYIKLRGLFPGPLFVIDKNPVKKAVFALLLKQALQDCNIPASNFTSHSFRIGAGSYWAQQGYSDTQIRLLGRWKSNAMVSYLRGSINHPPA